MTRIQQLFDRRKSEGKAALVAYLTAGDPTPEATPGLSYQLEVSSPGIERTLRTPEQYRRYLGSPVSVKTTEAVRGSRRWTGMTRRRRGSG